MTSQTTQVLIVDDDINSVRYLTYLLEREIPNLSITSRLSPDVSGAFDVYLIDNDFEGSKIAGRLTEEIRLRQPDALILLFSASLDLETLKELLNAGCDAVADKAEPKEQALLIDLIRRYREQKVRDQRSNPPRRSSLASVIELIREWNTRYELSRIEETRS